MAQRSRLPFILLGTIVALTVLFALSSRVVELLWMDALGYSDVFWTLLGTRVLLFVIGLVVAGAYFGANLYLLLREVPVIVRSDGELSFGLPGPIDAVLTRRRLAWLASGAAAFLAFLFAVNLAARWDDWIRLTGSTPYGAVDPVFGHDLSFYLLELPFIDIVQGTLLGMVILGLLLTGTGYTLLGRLTLQRGRLLIPRGVARHLTINALLLLATLAWGFYLDRYGLLFSPSGVVYGAGYTDVTIGLPALWVAVVATLALAALLATNLFKARLRLTLAASALYVLLLVAGLGIVPAVVQSVSVEPNELQLETPYLMHNIAFTRSAYGLDRLDERSYAGGDSVTVADVEANDEAIRNIRLWDPRLLIQTFRQIQEIRSYYQFYNVDVDRYVIDGEYRQVMVSARELAPRLPERADTWVNRHLQYTHGYGLTMNPVAQQGAEGTPDLYIRDLPPVVTVDGIQVDEAAIYYGEGTPTYRIVDSEVEELDYPRGDDNVYTHYSGQGGVVLSSIWREMLFAWYFSDFNLFLSGYIERDSRIQFWNRVPERIRRIAPFLQLDGDPYLVVTEGRLVWIQDAYTLAGSYPYSEPTRGGVNYLRNSVKIVVDAYQGSVDFYVTDVEDPIIRAYQDAFPTLFQPIEAMSEGLQGHLRYPMDLFEVQISKLSRYHMTVPQVFYNNEDVWTRPQEKYGGQAQTMEPYYVLTRLPGEERLEFMLMTPLTPQGRDNMIAWVAARCDQPGYGDLVLYELPKDRLILGPQQVESLIDQDTEISQQLSLWDQRGSRVIRGNLIAVPLSESFLYVEPVFLIAEGAEIPQLQRVIASDGFRVSMQRTLEGALTDMLGRPTRGSDTGEVLPSPALAGSAPDPGPVGSPQSLDRARQTFDRLEAAFQRGDFEAFGRELEALRRTLDQPTPAAPPPVPADTSVSL